MLSSIAELIIVHLCLLGHGTEIVSFESTCVSIGKYDGGVKFGD